MVLVYKSICLCYTYSLQLHATRQQKPNSDTNKHFDFPKTSIMVSKASKQAKVQISTGLPGLQCASLRHMEASEVTVKATH